MDTKRILVVDDEPTFSRRIKLVLEQKGAYEVIEENNATHAVVRARGCLPEPDPTRHYDAGNVWRECGIAATGGPGF